MVLEIGNVKYESKNEKTRRRSSFPVRADYSTRYSTTLSLHIFESDNSLKSGGGLQRRSLDGSMSVKEPSFLYSPSKSDNESGYSDYSSLSRIVKSATFTIQAMEVANFVPCPEEASVEEHQVPKEDEDEGPSRESTPEKLRKCRFEKARAEISPRHSKSMKKRTKEETKTSNVVVNVETCDSGAESASSEKESHGRQALSEIPTINTTPVKNGKGKFGGLKKRKSLDKSSKKSSLRNETTQEDVPPSPSLSTSSSPAKLSQNGRKSRSNSSPSPPLSLPLSISLHEDVSGSISSIVEYEGAKKVPKRANIETMRAMGLTEERKPKLSSRGSFKMWKRSALQYIKSHASNVSKGKMYRMNAAADQTKKDEMANNHKSDASDDQQNIPINGNNQLSVGNYTPAEDCDFSPTEEYKSNCSPMYKCYQSSNSPSSPYSDEKTRKWRRVRRAFSELYPSRCIDPRMNDEEPRPSRKSQQKASNRKTMLSMNKTNSQFDLRSIGAIDNDSSQLGSNSFSSETASGQKKDHSDSTDKKSKNDEKSKLHKTSMLETACDPEVTSKSQQPILPVKSNGLSQTAPHRIDFQKYVINPNRENCRRSSIAEIPSANSLSPNTFVPQKEQHSRSLECSRTETELKQETDSSKTINAALEKMVVNEEITSISRDSSCSTFQLISISPDSKSTSSTPTITTFASQDISSLPTSQISSCTTSNSLTTSSSSETTTTTTSSTDEAANSPTFEEYVKVHGGLNFGRGLAMHGGMPVRDHPIASRGVTANLTPPQKRTRSGSVTLVNRATSPIYNEMDKENALPQRETVQENKGLNIEEPKAVTRSSFPGVFRRTQEISCRLLNADEATATRNSCLVPCKPISPGLVTIRYPRNPQMKTNATNKKTDANIQPSLPQKQKFRSSEAIDKLENKFENHIYEEISKVRETQIPDSKSCSQESTPVPPPRRRLKEQPEVTNSSILKKNATTSCRTQDQATQERTTKESERQLHTKIPTSRKNTSYLDGAVRPPETPPSPVMARKVYQPASPLPKKRDYSPKPVRACKSMPSSPDLGGRRDLRIAGGVPSSPEYAPKPSPRVKSHVPPSPEISKGFSKGTLGNRPAGPESGGAPKRSRIAMENAQQAGVKRKDEEVNESEDPGPERAPSPIYENSSNNKGQVSEATTLKNRTAEKQVKTETGSGKNGRVMTPKRINVNSGLQLVSRPAPTRAATTNEPSKGSRIPVSKLSRPDVIPKKTGRLAMNRLLNPNPTSDKSLKTSNSRASRPVSTDHKYSRPHSETSVVSHSGSSLETQEIQRALSYELEANLLLANEIRRTPLSRPSSAESGRDLENEAKSNLNSGSHFKTHKYPSGPESFKMDEEETVILEISREEIDHLRRRALLEKTMSCEVETGSLTGTPTRSPKSQPKKADLHLVAIQGESGDESKDAARIERSISMIKKQDAAAQTSIDEATLRVLSKSPSFQSRQDTAAQTYESELTTRHSAGGMTPVTLTTRQTPHQIKMGGAALRARANTDPSESINTKYLNRTLDNRWELANYADHVQQLMVVEEGQARLYDLKPASCQNIQIFSPPSEYSLGSTTSTEHSADAYMSESASVDRCLGSLAKTRYRYNLSNSMAGGLDAIAQSNADQNLFESASNASVKDMTLESVPQRRRAASLSNIEYPRKASYKKNRKRSRLSTFFDIFQRKRKPILVSEDVDLPTHFRMIGRILEMCLDGTRIIELTQPPHGLCGIYMTRVKHAYGYGIYVSRFCDGYPAKMFAGLLAIGDQILEINGVSTDKMSVEEAHDMVASRDTLILRVLPDPSNYRVSTLPR